MNSQQCLWGDIEETLDVLILLTEDWLVANHVALSPRIDNVYLQIYRLMHTVDSIYDFISKLDEPSPVKRAAALCFYYAKKRPIMFNNSNHTEQLPYECIHEVILNSQVAFEVASYYLNLSQFMGDSGPVDILKPIRLPSFHFTLDFVISLCKSDENSIMMISMMLELMLYMANPHLAGIIDKKTKREFSSYPWLKGCDHDWLLKVLNVKSN